MAPVLVVAGMASTVPAGPRVVGTDQAGPLRLVEDSSAGAAPTGYALGGRGFLIENDGRLRPVNIPGATGTAPLGINVRGQIVGAYDDRDGVSHGFVRDERGRVTTIDHPRAHGVRDGIAGTIFSAWMRAPATTTVQARTA
jgi:YD repeat-containing protein